MHFTISIIPALNLIPSNSSFLQNLICLKKHFAECPTWVLGNTALSSYGQKKTISPDNASFDIKECNAGW
jgi:hypothetical protein